MKNHGYNPDHLKPLAFVNDPDPRSNFFETFDPDIRNFRPLTLVDHYESISFYTLVPPVPEEIITHFETGKNLYLYAWFTYRFYPVADLHVHATLELALKERIGKGNLQNASKCVGKRPGLNAYILYAIQQGWVRNEGFQRWWQSARVRAEHRASMELIAEMERTGATEAVWDPSQVEITGQDKSWDFMTVLAESAPRIRNEYAHGSSMLHRSVLGSFEVVAEFIKQLWPA
jgi:hypothetical protein